MGLANQRKRKGRAVIAGTTGCGPGRNPGCAIEMGEMRGPEPVPNEDSRVRHTVGHAMHRHRRPPPRRRPCRPGAVFTLKCLSMLVTVASLALIIVWQIGVFKNRDFVTNVRTVFNVHQQGHTPIMDLMAVGKGLLFFGGLLLFLLLYGCTECCRATNAGCCSCSYSYILCCRGCGLCVRRSCPGVGQCSGQCCLDCAACCLGELLGPIVTPNVPDLPYSNNPLPLPPPPPYCDREDFPPPYDEIPLTDDPRGLPPPYDPSVEQESIL